MRAARCPPVSNWTLSPSVRHRLLSSSAFRIYIGSAVRSQRRQNSVWVYNNHLRTMQDIDLSPRTVPDLLAHLYASSCFTNNNCAAAGAQSGRLGSMLIKTLRLKSPRSFFVEKEKILAECFQRNVCRRWYFTDVFSIIVVPLHSCAHCVSTSCCCLCVKRRLLERAWQLRYENTEFNPFNRKSVTEHRYEPWVKSPSQE